MLLLVSMALMGVFGGTGYKGGTTCSPATSHFAWGTFGVGLVEAVLDYIRYLTKLGHLYNWRVFKLGSRLE